MRTLRDFLLAEANLHEGDEDLPKIKKRDWDTWDKLSPGRLSNEVKALLKVKSAKEAKLVVGNENAKAISNPKDFIKQIEIDPNKDFSALLKSITKSAKDFRIFFSSVGIEQIEGARGKVGVVTLSDIGKKVISKDTQLVRFYKFWFDSIFWACLRDGQKQQRREFKYRYNQGKLYMYYNKA